MAFALAVIRFCRMLSYTCESNAIRDQLVRSGISVGANYRSSRLGRTPKEKRASSGSLSKKLNESDFWLSVLEAIEEGDRKQRGWLLKECGELIRIFSTALATHRSKESARRKLPQIIRSAD